MIFDLTGQVVVITAGAAKAGREIALYFADSGADVSISYLPRQKEKAERVKTEIEAKGKRCFIYELDLMDTDRCEGFIEETEKYFGRIDALILNGASGQVVDFKDAAEEDWDISNRVTVRSSAFLSRAAAKVMLKNKHGRIIALGGNSYYENDAQYVVHGNAKHLLGKLITNLAAMYTPWIMCNLINMNMFYPFASAEEGNTGFEDREADYKDAMFNLGGTYEYNGRTYRCNDTEGVCQLLVFLTGCKDSCGINGALIPMDCGQGLNLYRYS